MSWDAYDAADTGLYKQCLVSREADGVVWQQYTWLPVEKAKDGALVKLKDDGSWAVWRIDIVFCQTVPGSYLESNRKARKGLT